MDKTEMTAEHEIQFRLEDCKTVLEGRGTHGEIIEIGME